MMASRRYATTSPCHPGTALTTPCRNRWTPRASDDEPSTINPILYEPSQFVSQHTVEAERESFSEWKAVKEFNNPSDLNKSWTYRAYVMTTPSARGVVIRVNIEQNHEIFPAVGEICQIQLERGATMGKENSSPRVAERVEFLQSFSNEWNYYAEFHVAPTPSDHWIDEARGEQDEGKSFEECRPSLCSLKD